MYTACGRVKKEKEQRLGARPDTADGPRSAESLDGEHSLAVMTLETPMFCPLDWIFIASKLDTDISK
jgi:hypothetical protein